MTRCTACWTQQVRLSGGKCQLQLVHCYDIVVWEKCAGFIIPVERIWWGLLTRYLVTTQRSRRLAKSVSLCEPYRMIDASTMGEVLCNGVKVSHSIRAQFALHPTQIVGKKGHYAKKCPKSKSFRILVIVSTNSTLMTRAPCYPGTHSLYLIPGLIPLRLMTVTIAKTVPTTRMVTTVRTITMAMTTTAIPMAIAGFSLKDKLRKVRFFQETFLVADTRMEMVWSWEFLSSPSAVQIYGLQKACRKNSHGCRQPSGRNVWRKLRWRL